MLKNALKYCKEYFDFAVRNILQITLTSDKIGGNGKDEKGEGGKGAVG